MACRWADWGGEQSAGRWWSAPIWPWAQSLCAPRLLCKLNLPVRCSGVFHFNHFQWEFSNDQRSHVFSYCVDQGAHWIQGWWGSEHLTLAGLGTMFFILCFLQDRGLFSWLEQFALIPTFSNGCVFWLLESGLHNFLTFLLWLGRLLPHAAGSVPFLWQSFSLPRLRDIFLDPLWASQLHYG